MYSEKVQKLITNLTTYWNKVVIDTMGIEYKIHNYNKTTVIRFTNNDTENLYKILENLNNCVVIFDRVYFWFDSDMGNPYEKANELFTKLNEISKKNNLLIFT